MLEHLIIIAIAIGLVAVLIRYAPVPAPLEWLRMVAYGVLVIVAFVVLFSLTGVHL